MTYTDKELMESARDDAFNGLMKITALRGHDVLKAALREHFTAILQAIDAADVPM